MSQLSTEKRLKAGDIQNLAKNYTKSLPNKNRPNRADNLNHIKSHFEGKHGSLKEEFFFFEDELLELFTDEELSEISYIVEN